MAYKKKTLEGRYTYEFSGMEHHIIYEYHQFEDTTTGEKAGCTDPLAHNYCLTCNVSLPDT